jgi:hypothetical protein
MLCDFRDGECIRCGVRRSPPYPRRNCTPGLGDMLSAGLSAVGITKERVQRLADRVGISDCGCSQRRQLLNSLGHAVGIGQKQALQAPQNPAQPDE